MVWHGQHQIMMRHTGMKQENSRMVVWGRINAFYFMRELQKQETKNYNWHYTIFKDSYAHCSRFL